MKIPEEKVKAALSEAYDNAGENAYFGNGFKAGVDFALSQIKDQDKRILGEFFTHGQESVNCDECGNKGTELSFNKLYQNRIAT